MRSRAEWSLQIDWPQFRQWWRFLNGLNFCEQMWQFGAIIHRGGSDTTVRVDNRDGACWSDMGFSV
jgi:hypothetical protein